MDQLTQKISERVAAQFGQTIIDLIAALAEIEALRAQMSEREKRATDAKKN